MITAADIIKKAESYVGVKEAPRNSNNVIFNTDYYGRPVSGPAYPWCCAFVWDIFRMCGASALFGPKTAGCAYFEEHTPCKRVEKTEGQPGDIVTFDWGHDGHPDHIGIIKSRAGAGVYKTIEGNTSISNNSNGGQVMIRTRSISSIHAVFRPSYGKTVTRPTTQAPASQPAQTAAKPSGSQLVRDAQGFIHNFVDGDVKVDGIRGAQTNKGVIQVLQRCIDLDYGVHLAYDGIAGAKTLAALGKHYVKRGEKQYLVSFVEVALSALNYDPTGIENPGIFGSGLENAVKVFQRDAGLTADGVAGYRTLRALIAKF